MPGMGSYGAETIGGFYPYLFIDLLIVVALVWVCWGARVGFSYLEEHDGGSARTPASIASHIVPRIPARVFLRRTLGIIWIIDGLLQAQPAMPGGFAKQIVAPLAAVAPHSLANLLNWEVYFWQAHPLDLAVATVLAQVGIGVAILAGGDSVLGRAGLWASIGWGLFVWVGGEAMGGLLSPGTTELMGSPGAVLVYVTAAALLLAPIRIWTSGRLPRRIRLWVGLLFIFGAILQAIPGEGFWTGKGLSAMFFAMAKVPQPGFLSAPVVGMGHLAQAHPVLLNSVLIAILVILGAGLISGRAPRRWTIAAWVWLGLTWWVGQDFGALGSKTATDPNLSPLVAVMLVCAWIGMQPEPERMPAVSPIARSRKYLRQTVALGGFLAIVVGLIPVLLGLPVASAQSATIEALTTGGPVSAMNGQNLPDLTLVNQIGRQVDLRQWPGKALVITFLDPVCFDQCPVVAEQLATADRQLGVLAKNVEFVAIVANPIYRSLSVVQAFNSELSLNHLNNWQYLTGSLPQLERAWADFSIQVEIPRLQMVGHPTVLYFVKPGNREVSLAQDSALSDSSVISSYATLVDQQLRAVLTQ